MPDNIKLSVTLPVQPNVIYNAWFDKETHSAFTNSTADIQKKVGYNFTSIDGFIEGEIKQMVLSKKIIMSWKTKDFPEGSEDAQLTVTFEKLPNGTKVIFMHENLPEGEGKKYRKNWKDNYLNPMKEYFKQN
jgi:activator of HSP90 ATPase